MKIIKIIMIIGVAAALLFGTLTAFISQGEDFVTATGDDGYTWISIISGGTPTALLIGLVAIVIGVIIFAFRR